MPFLSLFNTLLINLKVYCPAYAANSDSTISRIANPKQNVSNAFVFLSLRYHSHLPNSDYAVYLDCEVSAVWSVLSVIE